MSANTVPRFISTPKAWAVKMDGTTPTAGADGSGTLFTLVTGADEGSKVDHIFINAQGQTDDALTFIFLQTSAGTNFLLDELIIDATSASAAKTPDFGTELTPTKPYIVPKNWKIMVGSNSSHILNVVALGGDY